MAGEFTALLSELGIAKDDLGVLEPLAGKYPDLDKFSIGYKDLMVRADALTTEKSWLEARAQELQTQLTDWEGWRDRNWVSEKEMTKGQLAAEEELTQVRQRLTEIEGRRPQGEKNVAFNDQDFASIREFMSKEGYAKKDDLGGLTSKADFDALKTDHNNTKIGFEWTFMNTAHLPFKFNREFSELGQDFEMMPFVNFLNANPERMKDVNKSYEEYVAPFRERLTAKKKEDELKTRETQLAAKEAELAAKQAGGPSPTDSGAGTPQLGTLERQRLQPKDDANKIQAKLGDGSIAALAAEQYRKGELVPKDQIN